jgi:3D (Asp-Asp-Asp) domain-containing protein
MTCAVLGAAVAALAAQSPQRVQPVQRAARAPAATGGHWLTGVAITEYWPVPESWFRGTLVRMPGIKGMHRVDWLYSGTGLLMEADGLGLDGKAYHVDSFGSSRWVNAKGQLTKPTKTGVWTNGDPAWRNGGWRNANGEVTFPLEAGGWSNGDGTYLKSVYGVKFARGPSLPLRYYHSVAIDPAVIPQGSRIYIPAYKSKPGGGWFVAADTGTGIIGRHIDVFRPPPANANGGLFLKHQHVLVIPPHR